MSSLDKEKSNFDVAGYWEERYKSGRDSGSGSYNRLAKFKADFINEFIRKQSIKSAVELGCGDGNQLSLIDYNKYIGLDISVTVIDKCKEKFKHDASKEFRIYDPDAYDPDTVTSELSLSLDVIYHLSNDEIYKKYLTHLFKSASKFVIIYSNSQSLYMDGVNEESQYVRFRKFEDDVEEMFSDWILVDVEPNFYPFNPTLPDRTSFADFYIYAKKNKNNLIGKFRKRDDTKFLVKKILNKSRVNDEQNNLVFKKCNELKSDSAAILDKLGKIESIKELLVSEQNKVEKVAKQLVQEKIRAEEMAKLLESEKKKSEEMGGQLAQERRKSDEMAKQLESEKKNSEKLSVQLEQEKNKNKELANDIEVGRKQTQSIKSSTRYQLGYHMVRAAKSWRGALGLPFALFRIGKRHIFKKKEIKTKKNKINRLSLYRGLRGLKWKVVVPFATRLGIPYSRVAHLAYPQPFNRRKDQKVNGNDEAHQFKPPSPIAQEISILGWPEQPLNGKPYVMGIMDEFTTRCFEQDVNLIQPRPDNWYALAEKYQPELIFIESAWKGNYGSWQYRVGDYANKPGQEVAHLCQYAKEKGIPTLFWNKEDPVHHQKFMCSAKLVDYIFTTDANMKDSYRDKTCNPNVHALPFAAQPALHKPAPLAGRKPRACFAGSWYGNRHAERGESLRWLLEAANQHGLDIYDRNHGTGIFPFPEEYQGCIKGSLPYKELCDEYSRYRVFLNVNSVTDSPTMFSRRVFELMACGTPVVSTYAKGIEKLFETDAVWLVNSQKEADEALHTLMTDDAEWRRRSLAGIREVFSQHTYAHRLNDIFKQLGVEANIETTPEILLTSQAKTSKDLKQLGQFAKSQYYRHFWLAVECSLKLASNLEKLPDNMVVLQPGELYQWIQKEQTPNSLIGWVSPDNHYGQYYLTDLINASLYEPQAKAWGKASGQDSFSYELTGNRSATLWRVREFLAQDVMKMLTDNIQLEGLYLADSDQFQLATKGKNEATGS